MPASGPAWRPAALASLLTLLLPGLDARAHTRHPAEVEAADARVEAHPTDREAWLARARLRLRWGDPQRALEDLDHARRLGADPARLDRDRGLALLEVGRAGEAEAHLRAFLERERGHVRARVALARALAQLGRPRQAAAELERAIERSPAPTPDLYLSRARHLAEADGGDPSRALRSLEEARARFGSLVALESYAIELERRAGRFEAALERLERLAASSPRRESWLLRRAEILEEAGRSGEAAGALRLALREIERLPPQRRETPAIVQLQERARLSLERLAATGTPERSP